MRHVYMAITIAMVGCVVLVISHFKLKPFSTRLLARPLDYQTFKSQSATVKDYVFNFSQQIKPSLLCIPFLTIIGEIPICVHENREYLISRPIPLSEIRESQQSRSLQNILAANSDYGFVDIGTNIGMFSLLAANLKRPVLAVEAMDINIEIFHQSVVINRFQQYIKLVTKPLSDKHETLDLNIETNNSSIIKRGKPSEVYDGEVHKEKKKSTLLLDELIDLMPRKKAVMIMDVEGNEGKVIRGGQKFFDAIHISHVFMEWNLLNQNDRKFLVDFFTKRGYKPFKSPKFEKELDISTSNNWSPDVFWKLSTDISFLA